MSQDRLRSCADSLSPSPARDLKSRRSWSCRGALKAALLAVLCLGRPGAADEPAIITRVEEDWTLQIGVPTPDENAPQLTIVNTPGSNLNGPYAVFEINHIPVPEFYGGGLQLQSWVGDVNMGACHHTNVNSLAQENETISFTTSMTLSDGALLFEVSNGVSDTWGTFGGNGALRLSLPVGSLNLGLVNLGGYSPDKSVEFSRVSFAGNRVKRLVIKEVRYYAGGNLVARDQQQRVVHSYNGGQ